MGSWIDRPVEVRNGEELDIFSLEAFLERNIDSFEPPVRFFSFPAVSQTSPTSYPGEMQDGCFAGRLLAPNIKSGHDMKREYTILTGLSTLYPKAPRPLLFCDDTSVLGAPFYIMERIEGVILRASMPDAMQPSERTHARHR